MLGRGGTYKRSPVSSANSGNWPPSVGNCNTTRPVTLTKRSRSISRVVAWALAATGCDDLTAVQQRTWNLSMIWHLDDADGPVAWLKQVPAMFAPRFTALMRSPRRSVCSAAEMRSALAAHDERVKAAIAAA